MVIVPPPRSGARVSVPRGVALINALLIVAALSAITVTLLQRSEASSARLIELKRAGQAELYVDAVILQLGEVIGPAERGQDGETVIVERGQGWAQPARDILIGQGVAAWQVDDLQGRFNLAWLAEALEALPDDDDDDDQPPPDLNAMLRDAFRQIALARGLSRGQVRRLEQALIPDLGQRVTAYGRATRPPPLPLLALDELLLVEGIDEAALDRLRPVVASIPGDGVGLNLNTVDAEVLAAFMGESSADTLRTRLASERPFATVEDALEWVESRGGADARALMEALDAGVESSWFEARIDVQLDTLVLTRRVVLQRVSSTACCRILSVLPENP